MGITFGLVAFILSLIGAVLPYYGIMIGWAALALATVSALYGARVLPVVVVIVSIINYLFLSPSLWLSALGPNDSNWIEISILMTAAPIMAMVGRKFFLFVRQK
ncbi:hypothetical protein H7X87_01515 [Acetobacteraceae bacterium]|nr:hypothetical protein [Candidatus Parcubacteria bacterium]